MKLRFLIVAAFIGITSGGLAQTPSQKEHWFLYEPAIVELRGKLIIASKYGPPGYGEDPSKDEKVEVPILVLSRPINVRGNAKGELNTESVVEVKEVQLVFGQMPAHKQLIGRLVIAKGTLFHAESGHHYTTVLMNVSKIKDGGPSAM